MTWPAANITAVRVLVSDTPVSKLNRGETPKNPRNGANKVFQLDRFPIVPGSVFLTSGANIRVQNGFAEDDTNGLITFTAAPVGTESPWYVDYNWLWFSDTEYGTFLDSASEDIGFNPTAIIPPGLNNALNAFAAYHMYEALAAKYASKFNSTGGGQGVQVDVVTGNFLKLANAAKDKGLNFLNLYYQRSGRRNAPAAALAHPRIDPWTPPR